LPPSLVEKLLASTAGFGGLELHLAESGASDRGHCKCRWVVWMVCQAPRLPATVSQARTDARLACTYSGEACASSVDLVHSTAGRSALYETGRIARCGHVFEDQPNGTWRHERPADGRRSACVSPGSERSPVMQQSRSRRWLASCKGSPSDPRRMFAVPIPSLDYAEGRSRNTSSCCVNYFGSSTAYAWNGPGLPRFSGGSNNVPN
jgi:hypothetical protein